ncbi:hypothetical protein BMR86_25865, partial [Stenotrophomonas sp. KAs 5-3]
TPTTRHGRVLPVRARLSEPYPVVKRFSVTAPLQAKPGEVVPSPRQRRLLAMGGFYLSGRDCQNLIPW